MGLRKQNLAIAFRGLLSRGRRWQTSLTLAACCFVGAGATAQAMDGFSTCHAAATTVTSIEGLGEPIAKMVSVETLPDALESCHRNDRLVGAALMSCAVKELRSDSFKNYTTADCRKGRLINETVFQRRRFVKQFEFPLSEINCGNEGQAAIDAFRKLCPDYEGRLGDEPH